MGGLSFLIYPWGFIVQGIALWHFIKRRPENYWLFIIIFGGVLGAGVYVVVEMIPDLGLLRGVFQGFTKRSRIQELETQILDNPSAGNLEELAELHFEQKNYAKAREELTRAISARGDHFTHIICAQNRHWEWAIWRGLYLTWSTLSARTLNSTTTGPLDCSVTLTRAPVIC